MEGRRGGGEEGRSGRGEEGRRGGGGECNLTSKSDENRVANVKESVCTAKNSEVVLSSTNI